MRQQTAPDKFQIIIKRFVETFNADDYTGIRRDFSEAMRAALPPAESDAFFAQLRIQLGQLRKVDAPHFIASDEAIFTAHFEHGTLDIKLALDAQNRISELLFTPRDASAPAIEKQRTELLLPFRERWLVYWGGDTVELNYHHDVRNQQYAFDFVGIGEDGKTHRGRGQKNEDFYAFGRKVLAPADGIVTDAIEGVRDNALGSMNPFSALGNAVFLQHHEGEVSVFAHLKLSSVKVKVGDRVKRGQIIGLCGNSGNSSEPHLHYHLQNTPVIQDAIGLKIYFREANIIVNNKAQLQINYSPVKGDIISPE